MDPTDYENLYLYLKSKVVPLGKDPKTYDQYAKKFEIKYDQVYINKKRLIQRHEVEDICAMYHDDPTGAHFAFQTIYEKIKERYFWNTLLKDVKEYCQSCDSCQRRGGPRRNNDLNPIQPSDLFARWGIDIVGPLPITERGNRYIVVAMDYFSRWPEARPLKAANAISVAEFIYDEIICRFSTPRIIQSDQGTHFVNEVIKQLTAKFRIKHKLSSPYHPQSNGLVERFNRTLCEGIAKIGDTLFDWDKFIQPVLFAYRIKALRISKKSPYQIVYGKDPVLPDDKPQDNQMMIDRLTDLIDKVPQLRQSAKRTIMEAQNKLAEKFRLDTPRKFEIGDLVLYYDKAKSTSHSAKFEEKWKGPFRVTKVLPKGAYLLGGIRTTVNGNLLKKYHDRESWEPIIVIENPSTD